MTKRIFVNFYDGAIRELVGSNDDVVVWAIPSAVETALRERYGPEAWEIVLSVDKIKTWKGGQPIYILYYSG